MKSVNASKTPAIELRERVEADPSKVGSGGILPPVGDGTSDSFEGAVGDADGLIEAEIVALLVITGVVAVAITVALVLVIASVVGVLATAVEADVAVSTEVVVLD